VLILASPFLFSPQKTVFYKKCRYHNIHNELVFLRYIEGFNQDSVEVSKTALMVQLAI